MSKPTHESKRKRGRPPTGRTKEIIKAGMDPEIANQAKKLAHRNGESFSKFVERAVHKAILVGL